MENILNTESQGTHESSTPSTSPDIDGERYSGGERENHHNHTPAKEPGAPEQK